MEEQYLTTSEVGYILNISTQTVLRLVRENRLFAIKLSRSYRIPYSAIEEFKMREYRKRGYK